MSDAPGADAAHLSSMHCCDHASYDTQFDATRARKDLERYREDGPDPTTRALLEAIRAERIEGASLLDIGGGVGVIHHELLEAGVCLVTHVDVSAPYIRAASDESETRGHADRVRFVRGDFVALAPELPPADVVTLDRVICCYSDMEALVASSAARARRLWGAVFPRDRWFLKLAFAVVNVFKRITGNAFRIYVHPTGSIDAALRREGLESRKELNTFMWRVAVYSRRVAD